MSEEQAGQGGLYAAGTEVPHLHLTGVIGRRYMAVPRMDAQRTRRSATCSETCSPRAASTSPRCCTLPARLPPANLTRSGEARVTCSRGWVSPLHRRALLQRISWRVCVVCRYRVGSDVIARMGNWNAGGVVTKNYLMQVPLGGLLSLNGFDGSDLKTAFWAERMEFVVEATALETCKVCFLPGGELGGQHHERLRLCVTLVSPALISHTVQAALFPFLSDLRNECEWSCPQALRRR